MKRSAALIPLSRDHHVSLVEARELMRATPENVGEAVERFGAHWREHAAHHFRVEEEVLLPGYAAHGDAFHPMVLRVLGEHTEIRARTAQLLAAAAPDPEAAASLGMLLNDHVRFEERELFPMIEEALPEPALAELATAVEQAEERGG